MTTENIQDVRIKKPMPGAPPPKYLSAPTRDRAARPATDAREVAAPRSPRDRWMITLTVAGLCVLAGVMATYILFPAVQTLVDPSTVSWTGEGP